MKFSPLIVPPRLRAAAGRARARLLGTGLLTLLAGAALAQPTVTTRNPARHADSAPVNTTVAVTFNQNITTSTGGNIRLFSPQYRGRRTATAVTSGATVTLTPTAASGSANFEAGEVISVTVPATVTAATGGAGAVKQVYQFTAAAASTSPAVFLNGSTRTTSAKPEGVELADVDNDGDLDMLIPHASDVLAVSVLRNNGSGVFGTPTDYATSASANMVTAADIDGDGDLDLLVGLNNGSVNIGTNNGSGVFTLSSLAVTTNIEDILAADVDADGDLDMLVLNNTTPAVHIRLNDGSGTFTGTGSIAVAANPLEMAVADVDNDGDLDVLTANSAAAGTVSVRTNSGAGVFSGSTNVSVGNNPQSVTMADIDGDFDLDMLTANNNTAGTASIRVNNGSGTFAVPAVAANGTVSVGASPQSIRTADVDGDGDLDLLTANSGDDNVSIRLNSGAGVFSGTASASVGDLPTSLATGDVNGDETVDFVTGDFGTMAVSATVRLNTLVPSITSFTPITGPVTTNVTVTGTNFTGATAFTLNGVTVGSFTVVNNKTITFTVPSGATTGRLAVTTPNGTGTSATDFTVIPPPTITLLTPSGGPIGTVVTLTGTGYITGSTVKFGTVSATVVTINSPTSITVTVPAGTVTGNVTVTNTNGTSNGVLFTIAARPLITALNPTRNSDAISRTSTIGVTFNQAMLNGGSIKIFSSRYRGLRTATASTSGNTVTLTPTTPSGGSQVADFEPGENLFVTVPPTVTGTTGAQVIPQVYQLTAAAGVGPATFSAGAAPTVSVAATTSDVVLADIDSDGDLDMLTASKSTTGTVSIRFNDGTGAYSGSTSVSVGASPYAMLMADVDGDGDLDLLTSNLANSVSVRFNDGSGVFSGTTNVSMGNNPNPLAVGDIDGDGDLDLVAGNTFDSNVSIRFNNGLGVFSGVGSIGIGGSPSGIAMADIDADGDLDMLVSKSNRDVVAPLINNGSGVFTAGTDVSVGTSPNTVVAADVDGDGDQDILAGNFGGSVSIRLNVGGGNFSGGTDVGATAGGAFNLRRLATGDVDGDGDLDFIAVTGSSTSGQAGIMINNGSGVFTRSALLTMGSNTSGVAVGDIDGDNDLDFVASNENAATVSVLFNQDPPPDHHELHADERPGGHRRDRDRHQLCEPHHAAAERGFGERLHGVEHYECPVHGAQRSYQRPDFGD